MCFVVGLEKFIIHAIGNRVLASRSINILKIVTVIMSMRGGEYGSTKYSEILPLSDFHGAVYNILLDTPPRVKNCVRNSMIGINKAWGLKCIDPEMAVFRAITAEEEAATAIIELLKVRKYDGAEKLNSKRHPHKAAIWFIISCVGNALSILDGKIEAQCSIVRCSEGKYLPRIHFRFVGQALGGWFAPEPPLNFSILKERAENDETQFLESEIMDRIEEKGKKDFLSYIREEANLRNQILYASQEGVARVDSDVPHFIKSRWKRVMSLLAVCSFIYCYSEQQLFVQYVLNVVMENITSQKNMTG